MANMRLATVTSAKSVAGLVRELYAVPERGGRRLTEEATRAVLEANPHLAGLSKIPEGTPIVVPELAQLDSADAKAPPPPSVSAFLDEAADALRTTRSSLAAAHADRVQEAKDTIEILRSREFKASAGDALTEPQAAAIAAASAATIKNAQAAADEDDAVLKELAAALAEFRRVVRSI